MKKSNKRFIVVFLFVFGIVHSSTFAFARTNIPPVTSDFYVNDFASIFSEDEKSWLIGNALALSNDYNGIQVVVSTIRSLKGESIESYALNMYNQYRIGKDDMGVLILLSTGDRKIRIETGKSMASYINDESAKRFIDTYAIPLLKENKFSAGLIALQKALISEIVTVVESTNLTDSRSNLTFVSALVIICIVAGLIVLLVFLIPKFIDKNSKPKQTTNNFSRDSRLDNYYPNRYRSHSTIDSSSNDSGLGGHSEGGGASGDF